MCIKKIICFIDVHRKQALLRIYVQLPIIIIIVHTIVILRNVNNYCDGYMAIESSSFTQMSKFVI
jgi:hypothetical protein